MDKVRQDLTAHRDQLLSKGYKRWVCEDTLKQYDKMLEDITLACRILLQNEDGVVDQIQEAIDMLWVYSKDNPISGR